MEKSQRQIVGSSIVVLLHKGAIALLHFIIYTNLLISAGAVALTLATLLLFNIRPIPYVLLWFVFCSTWLVYGLLKYNVFSGSAAQNGHTAWYTHYFWQSNAVLALVFVIVMVSFFQLKKNTMCWAMFPAFLTVAYYGFPTSANRRFSLRQLVWIKPLVVALVWALVTVVLPLTEVDEFPTYWRILFGIRVLYVTGLCVLFEIKDVPADNATGLRTIPQLFGIRTTQNLAMLLFGVAFVLALGLSRFPSSQPAFLAIAAIQLWCMLLCRWFSGNTHEKWYYIALDGTMLLLPVLVACFEKCLA